MRMRQLAHVAALACVSAMAVSPTVGAQSTRLALMRPEVLTASCPWQGCDPGPARLIEVDVEGARIESVRRVPIERGETPLLAATAEGRYLVWLGSEEPSGYPPVNLTVHDRVTGTTTVVHRQAPPGSYVRSYRIVAHPTETRVFARLYHPPTIDASTSGLKGLDVGGEFQTFHGITADGRVALISRDDAYMGYRVDTATGAILGELTGRQFASPWAISVDGAHVYAHAYRYEGLARFQVFTRYDAATGSVLSEREYPIDPWDFEFVRRLDLDPRTGRVYVDIGGGRYRVLHPDSLERIGLVATPLPPLPPLEPYPGAAVTGQLVFDPHHPRAFLLANRRMRPETSDRGVSRIDIVDTNTLALVGGADLGMEVGPTELVVVPRPPAPAALSASVTGSRVTLQWTPGTRPGQATGFRIEAGSQPGLSNLATLATGVVPELVVESVPAGAYYVRVRAVNWGGVSEASPEILVTVP